MLNSRTHQHTESAGRDTMIKRNSFMRIRFTQPPQIELLLENASFEIFDHNVVRAVVLADSEISIPDLLAALIKEGENESAEDLINELIKAGILVQSDYRHPLQGAAEHWQQRGWLDALVLHLRSRNINYADFGDTKFIRPNIAKPLSDSFFPEEPRQADPRDVPLPRSESDLFNKDLLEVMYKRRSGKPWSGKTLDQLAVGNLLYIANTDSRRNRKETSHDSSGSALFDCSSYSALETYVVVNNVEGIAPGVYGYSVEDHSLKFLTSGDFRSQLVKMCIGQMKVKECSMAFIIAAHWQRYMSRYQHPRAYRNLLINTAELAHQYILGATALELSNFITPAFNDEVAEEILNQRATKAGPLYMVAVG